MKIAVIFVLSCSLLVACGGKDNNKKSVELPSRSDSAGPIKTNVSINTYAPVDVSPMDMSYFPVDYPKLKMSKTTNSSPMARVIYSRPHLQGRKLFHEVLKYGEPWRLGANEATELDLYRDAEINGKKIKPGRYVLYCIPGADSWNIVLNSNIDSWGLEPDSTKDLAHFIVPATKTANSIEFFSMVFQQTPAGADLIMAWDDIEARLPFVFK
jgi:hypothetical protein